MNTRPTVHDYLISNISHYIEQKHKALSVKPRNSFFKSKDLHLTKDEGLDRAVSYLKFIVEANLGEKELFEVVKTHASQKRFESITGPLAGGTKLRECILKALLEFVHDRLGLIKEGESVSRVVNNRVSFRERQSVPEVYPSGWGGSAPVVPSRLEVMSEFLDDLRKYAVTGSALDGFYRQTGIAERVSQKASLFSHEAAEEKYESKSEAKGIEPVRFQL